MSSTTRAIAFACVILLHPLFVLGWLTGIDLRPGWSLAEAGYWLELILVGGFAFQMHDAIARRLERNEATADSEAEYSPAGFSLVTQARGDARTLVTTGGVALVLSTAPVLVAAALGMSLDPERFGIARFSASMVPVFVLLWTGLHVVLQAVPLALVLSSRARQQAKRTRRRVERAGRVLRVGDQSLVLTPHTRMELDADAGALRISDGDTTLEILGRVPTLQWIRDRLVLAEETGTRQEVPDALERLRAPPEPLGDD